VPTMPGASVAPARVIANTFPFGSVARIAPEVFPRKCYGVKLETEEVGGARAPCGLNRRFHSTVQLS